MTESADRRGRLARLPRGVASAILIGMVVLFAIGLVHPYAHHVRQLARSASDIGVYDRITDRVRHGQPYAVAAIAEQRLSGYPVRPFIAVRPPFLAYALSWLPGQKWGDILLTALAALVIAAWAFRLRGRQSSPLWLAGVPLLVFTGVEASMPLAGMSRIHETWAGLLVALSLALRTDRRFGAAVAVGLAAALVRELAMPYLLVMAAAAALEKRWKEAMAFAAALAIALAALAWDGLIVTHLTTAKDVASQGWLAFGGWPFVVKTARWNYIALWTGAWAAAALVPLALVGALNRENGLGLRLFALLAGYAFGFMFIGRSENYYWGLITAPIMSVALCFTPQAIGDLARAVLNRGGSYPSRDIAL